MKTALQYTLTKGFPPLYSWLTKIRDHFHGEPPRGWPNTSTLVTSGGMDAVAKIFDMTLEKGKKWHIPVLTFPIIS